MPGAFIKCFEYVDLWEGLCVCVRDWVLGGGLRPDEVKFSFFVVNGLPVGFAKRYSVVGLFFCKWREKAETTNKRIELDSGGRREWIDVLY